VRFHKAFLLMALFSTTLLPPDKFAESPPIALTPTQPVFFVSLFFKT